jgi:hypothetical protein
LSAVDELVSAEEKFSPQLVAWMNSKVASEFAQRTAMPDADRKAWETEFRARLRNDIHIASDEYAEQLHEGAQNHDELHADFLEPAFSRGVIRMLGRHDKSSQPEPKVAQAQTPNVRAAIELVVTDFTRRYTKANEPTNRYFNALQNQDAISRARSKLIEAIESHFEPTLTAQPSRSVAALLAKQIADDMLDETRSSTSEFSATHSEYELETLAETAVREDSLIERARQELADGRAPSVETADWHKVVTEFDAGRNWQAAWREALMAEAERKSQIDRARIELYRKLGDQLAPANSAGQPTAEQQEDAPQPAVPRNRVSVK